MRKEKIKNIIFLPNLFLLLKLVEIIYLNDGTVAPHIELTRGAQLSRSFAFCSDTKYYETIIPQISGVDMLYHEATFLDELKERARQTMHSTAKEAATIALKSNVGKLVIGHYSQRYFDLSPLLDEAQNFSRNIFSYRR